MQTKIMPQKLAIQKPNYNFFIGHSVTFLKIEFRNIFGYFQTHLIKGKIVATYVVKNVLKIVFNFDMHGCTSHQTAQNSEINLFSFQFKLLKITHPL